LEPKRIVFKNGFVVIWAAFYLTALLSPQLRVLKGNSDFLAQYTAGRLLLGGQGRQLYDIERQEQAQRRILASLNSDVEFAGGLLLFSHPPFVSLLYVAIAWLSYTPAFLVWNLASALCFVTGLAKLIRYYRIKSSTDLERLGLASLMYLPVSATLLQGQNTSVAFLCLVLAFLSFKRSNEFRAGLWLSLVLMKFQILPLLLLTLLVKRRGMALLGFLVGGSCLGVASLLVVRPAGVLGYLELLGQMSRWVGVYGVNPIGANCLRGQMYLLFYNIAPEIAFVTTLLFCSVFVAIALLCWRDAWKPESDCFDLKFALLIVVGLLVAPQINFHDLAFLLFPGVTLFHLSARDSRHPLAPWIVFIVAFPLQILSFMSLSFVPIQFNVIGMIVLTIVLLDAVRLKSCTLTDCAR
jgi:Glycosyltransferase family 87